MQSADAETLRDAGEPILLECRGTSAYGLHQIFVFVD